MMKKSIFILLAVLLSGVSRGQNFTSLLGGNWTAGLVTWGNLGGNYPQTGDNVTISALNTVTVTGSQQCNNLTVNGTLQIIGTGSLEADGTVTVATAGTLEVNSGAVTINGDYNYDGSLDIVPDTDNYVEIFGNVLHNGVTHLQTNNGSVIIYSELEF